MKNKFLLYFASVLFGLISYSQNAVGQEQKSYGDKKEKSLEEKMEGTYMIINKSSKFTEVLTTDILVEIEKKRDATREIYYEYSQYITIKILPKNVINAPDFDPKKFN